MKYLLALAVSLVAAYPAASAQDSPLAPAVRRPPIRAVSPAGAIEPGEPVPISELIVPAEEGRVEVRLKNARVDDALAVYAHLIGKQIVTDNSVQGRITIVSDGAVGKEDAATLIETGIFLNGFSMMDSEDGKIVKVIGLGRPARSEGVPMYSSVAELPKNERIVTLLVRLNHVQAQETSGFLSQYVSPGASVGFTPGRSGLLLVTGPTTLVRKLAKVVTAVDVPGKEQPSAKANDDA